MLQPCAGPEVKETATQENAPAPQRVYHNYHTCPMHRETAAPRSAGRPLGPGPIPIADRGYRGCLGTLLVGNLVNRGNGADAYLG